MNNQIKPDSPEVRIQAMIDRALKKRCGNNIETKENHLDDDTLNAFVEGNLTAKQNEPIIRHLVKCSFCRHITAELVKLDIVFAEKTFERNGADSKPSKVSDVLSNVLSSIFGKNDGAVFAHQETEDEDRDSENHPGNKEDKK